MLWDHKASTRHSKEFTVLCGLPSCLLLSLDTSKIFWRLRWTTGYLLLFYAQQLLSAAMEQLWDNIPCCTRTGTIRRLRIKHMVLPISRPSAFISCSGCSTYILAVAGLLPSNCTSVKMGEGGKGGEETRWHFARGSFKQRTCPNVGKNLVIMPARKQSYEN